MSRVGRIIFWWVAVFFWFMVIYYFSSQPSLKSDFQPFWDLILRKIAHMAEFFVLAYLFFNAYRSLGLKVGRSLLLAFIFSLVYAFFDEWHQDQVLGRTKSIIDVVIDGLGISVFIFLKLIQKSKN